MSVVRQKNNLGYFIDPYDGDDTLFIFFPLRVGTLLCLLPNVV